MSYLQLLNSVVQTAPLAPVESRFVDCCPLIFRNLTEDPLYTTNNCAEFGSLTKDGSCNSDCCLPVNFHPRVGYQLNVVRYCSHYYYPDENQVLKLKEDYHNQLFENKTCLIMRVKNEELVDIDLNAFSGFQKYVKMDVSNNIFTYVPELIEDGCSVDGNDAGPNNFVIENIILDNNPIDKISDDFLNSILTVDFNISMANTKVSCCSHAVQTILEYDVPDKPDFTFLGTCIAPTSAEQDGPITVTKDKDKALIKESCSDCFNNCSGDDELCDMTTGICVDCPKRRRRRSKRAVGRKRKSI